MKFEQKLAKNLIGFIQALENLKIAEEDFTSKLILKAIKEGINEV